MVAEIYVTATTPKIDFPISWNARRLSTFLATWQIFSYADPMELEILPRQTPREALRLPASSPKATVEVSPEGVLHTFLSRGKEWTKVSYANDLKDFQSFTREETKVGAVSLLLAQDQGGAQALVMSYQNYLREKKLSAATINRRLAALSSLVKLAQLVGLVSYQVKVERVPDESYRDTRGPGKEGVQQMLGALNERSNDAKKKRDNALVRLLFDLALRRNEALSLDIEHLNLKQKTVSILGKGRSGRQMMSLPDSTCEALKEWLKERARVANEKTGPVFVSVDAASVGHRLTGQGLHKLLKKLGLQVGLTVRPHGIRHAAITAALDATGGDVRKVQKFSRHKDLRVLCVYDDSRLDHAGEVSRLVAL